MVMMISSAFFFSLSMVVLFPCNNFLSLSTVQQVRVKFLFKQKLRQLVHSLTALSLEILNLGKVSIGRKQRLSM